MLQPGEVRAVPTTPWHLWVVGVVSLIWNLFGCYDYVMSKLRPDSYLGSMGPDVVAYMRAFPAWLTAFWALGVWGSLAGSVLLLRRSRHAVIAFALSLIGLAVSQGYQIAMAPAPGMNGAAMQTVTVVIWTALLLFLVYAQRMKAVHVLR